MTSLAEATINEHVLAGQSESASVRAGNRFGEAPPGGRTARLVARLRAGSLDRRLIAGANPADAPQLAARVEALLAPGTRLTIATGLEALLEAARGRRGRWCAVGSGEPLLANAQELNALAVLLRGRAPLNARGVALLSELLSDGTGPAYRGGSDELAHRLLEARAALQA